MLLERILDRIGDWNPQLRRELKTRLTLPNLTIATFVSLLVQILTVILPDPRVVKFNNHYWHIDPYWWVPICILLNRELWLTMTIGGTYLIARDFAREIRTGTLNLVNISPAKPLEILFGKLLGVPILVYYAVFLALPLHFVSISQITDTAPNAWLWDLVALTLCGLLYLYSVLSIILLRIPPILPGTILPAIGSVGLVIIGSHLNHPLDLGVYFADEWSLLLGASLTFFVGSFPVVKLIQSWYPHINSLRTCKHALSVLLLQYPFLLLIYIPLVSAMPLATLIATIVITIAIIKMKKVK